MSDTPSLMRYGGFVALIAVFAVTLNDWDASAPTLAGWSELQATLGDDPSSSFPTMTNVTAPDLGACDWWDIGCLAGELFAAVIYIGSLIYYFLAWVAAVTWWFALEVVVFFGALIGAASLTLTGIPAWLQALLWILAAPLLILVLWSVIRLIRGDEG